MSTTKHYDREGVLPAMSVIRELDRFIDHARERASGAVFEEEVGVLLPFLHGLSGRKLKLATADRAYTDTETIFLPPMLAILPELKENIMLYNATLAHHWAQIRFGTFHVDMSGSTRGWINPAEKNPSCYWPKSSKYSVIVTRFMVFPA